MKYMSTYPVTLPIQHKNVNPTKISAKLFGQNPQLPHKPVWKCLVKCLLFMNDMDNMLCKKQPVLKEKLLLKFGANVRLIKNSLKYLFQMR